MAMMHVTRDEEWLLAHMADPVAIAPGVRNASDPAPRPALSRFEAQAAVSYLRRLHAGMRQPEITNQERLAASTYARTCVVCHKISGEGGTVGPDLSLVGRRRSADEIRQVIEDASMVYGDSVMPAFRDRLAPEQIAALSMYLASRQ
jgi:mono/diheme cytochrome c family protein